MREVNFSIPNANKASVGITTALYDRRALDCTSTLPLINSLNNLAYLTTSSGRIRDILTVDGGIERLVCILKEGRSRDIMEMWKWNLAFQCIVNIGVRGSEAVRTRVVEADMVPVIATILDNYFLVQERRKEVEEMANRKRCPFTSRGFDKTSSRTDSFNSRFTRSRRQAPPPITIPDPVDQPEVDEPHSETTPTGPTANMSLSSPPERTTFPRHHHHRSHGSRGQLSTPSLGSNPPPFEPPMSAMPLHTATHNFLGLRPVRDSDRLPSNLPNLAAELSSQPHSPTTPVQRPSSPSIGASDSRPRRRPSIRHQLSISGSDDDGVIEEATSEDSNVADGPEPVVGIQTDIVMEDIVDEDNLLDAQGGQMGMAAPDVSSTDDETFSITHRSAGDGSLANPATTPTQRQMMMPQTPLPPPVNAMTIAPSLLLQHSALFSRGTLAERQFCEHLYAIQPRDEDVLMSLQLLAYVSKYCYLRSYFQQSHLVPRLKIGKDIDMVDPDYDPATAPQATEEELEDAWDNEFVAKPGEKPYNIFPLIERFTAKQSSRHSSTPPSPQQGEMQYWAGVVMRNLCRKDESRGGIRQCAYWRCGKWEEFTRQFAKCRRCRRTKYCSKECQKAAWGSHRFWCVAAEASDGDAGSSDRHRHGHSHSHGGHRHTHTHALHQHSHSHSHQH